MKKRTNSFFTSFSTFATYFFLTAKTYATTVSVNGMSDPLNQAIGEIISILFWIACVVCTLKIIHIGILYITTGAEGKSKAKGALLPWIIGVFICMTFASLGPAIMNLFYDPSRSVLDY